jgi:hypothetical protein
MRGKLEDDIEIWNNLWGKGPQIHFLHGALKISGKALHVLNWIENDVYSLW